jgi:Protein of unknown function (DUF3489)
MTHSDKTTASAAETTSSNPSRTEAKTAAKSPSRKHNVKSKPVKVSKPTRRSATAKRGSKKAKIMTLLKRPGGASLDQLQKATGWQAHSVRGFLSGELKNKMGLRVHSDKHSDGVRTYRLTSK